MGLLLLARILLAATFALAGAAKLADRDGLRQAAAELGSPGAFLRPLPWLIAAAELAVASALVVNASAVVGAMAALLLLVAFTAIVVVALAQGRRPTCHCFGRLSTATLGWSTVARNACLASIAAIIAVGGLPSYLAAIVVLSMAWWLVLEHRAGPLRAGAQARAFALEDRRGRSWTLETLLAPGKPLLLLFTAPRCPACAELIGEVATWREHLAGRLTIAAIGAGPGHRPAAPADEQGALLVLEDPGGSVARACGIEAVPAAVLIRADGTVAAPLAVGGEAISGIVAGVERSGSASDMPRRALLGRAATATVALTVLPILASASSAARTVQRAVRPKSLKIEGAFLCDQKYALCTSARCVPSKTDPKIAICRCKIRRGYSVGFKSCEQRAPNQDTLHSNFSLQDVTPKTRTLKCAARGLWTQCLDAICEVDPRHPDRADCQCVKMETKDFFTFGGNCDADTCSTVIWSATTAPFPGGAQYAKGMKRLGLHVRTPKSCPAPRSSA